MGLMVLQLGMCAALAVLALNSPVVAAAVSLGKQLTVGQMPDATGSGCSPSKPPCSPTSGSGMTVKPASPGPAGISEYAPLRESTADQAHRSGEIGGGPAQVSSRELWFQAWFKFQALCAFHALPCTVVVLSLESSCR
jgi:hypothetical protein